MANELRSRTAGVAGVLSSALVLPPVPSFRAVNVGTRPFGGSVNVAIPASAQPGDMLIIVTNASNTLSPSAITGFTSLGSWTTQQPCTTVWYRTCIAGDPGTNVSIDLGSNEGDCAILAYQNAGVPVVKGTNVGGSGSTSLAVTPANVAVSSLALYVLNAGTWSQQTLSAGSSTSRVGQDSGHSSMRMDLLEEASPATTAANQLSGIASGMQNVSLEIPTSSPSTNMVSDGLADLPVIDATKHAPIMLFRTDNNGRITKKEIVYVMAHTSANTTASIVQGQEGTSSQGDWAAGDAWVHGPTPLDFSTPLKMVTKVANYTATESDVVLADASGGAFAVTLPAAALSRRVIVKKIDSSANAVTVTPASGTIDGATTLPISTQYASYELMSDGTNWWVV